MKWFDLTHLWFDLTKINLWCGRMHDCVVGQFLYVEDTMRGTNYFNMLEIYVFPQADDIERTKGMNVTFHQDGAPPHYILNVHEEALDR